MKRAIAGLFILACFAGIAGLWLRHDLFRARFKGFAEPVFIDIPRGATTRQVGEMLTRQGVIAAAWQIQALRVLRPGSNIQAGEYRFADAATAASVYDRLRRGEIYTVEFRVPEGSNMFDIAELAELEGLVQAEEFLKVARRPDLIADLDPQAPSLEGYLFPSTYRFRRKVSAEEIARTMTQQFRKTWKALGSAADPHAAVTLASLVEKEAKLPEERARIAGVYANRLAQGMKLDCDPTVIYASQLSGRWRGTIYRSDLDREHPFNTYQRRGLPPGPIANPGLKSLEAALEPARTDEIFFVARPDGSGGHVFSSDAKSHEKAVAQYRHGVKAQANSGVAAKPPAR